MPEQPSTADRLAALKLIGCQHQDCPWEGVVEVHHHLNSAGPTWRACREHAAPYRGERRGLFVRVQGIDPNEYRVTDSGRPNRKLVFDRSLLRA